MNRLCTRIANVTAKYRPANKGARYTKTKIEQPKQSNFEGINWKAESIKIKGHSLMKHFKQLHTNAQEIGDMQVFV